MSLEEAVIKVKGVGEKTNKLLEKLGIHTKADLLGYFPVNYDEYGKSVPINEVKEGRTVIIFAAPSSYPVVKETGKRKITLCEVYDGSAKIELVWFNMPYIKNKLSKGVHAVFRGKAVKRGRSLAVMQPEILTEAEYLRKRKALQPVYHLTKGITSNFLRKSITGVLPELTEKVDYLPLFLRKEYSLLSLKNAVEEIHFPKSFETVKEARKRLVFDEFFLFALSIDMMKRDRVGEKAVYKIIPKQSTEDFIEGLPFSMTSAQKRVWDEITKDFKSGFRMNRLVQGDVGSGKTVLAVITCFLTAENGFQSSVMVPTEVLARQHFESFSGLLDKFNIKTVLLTGSVKGKERKKVLEEIENGEADIIIGTHALIQDSVVYKNLALVITDEQHRFGVRQREKLSLKGESPHVLVMSATPIPRTLAVILYGDLDISLVDELPAERLPVKNCVVNEGYRQSAYKFIKKEVETGHQAYIICPMIEKSDEDDGLADVINYTSELTEYYGGKFKIACLHGKLKEDEKKLIMKEFSEGKTDVLVSTTVVEVGVNVPNATVMMIENADRFGLASLHQLRGRIGRGRAQSYCIFVSGNESEESMERLRILNNSNDGFRIAEEDMRLRGPGDIFGIRQSGEMSFKMGDIIGDAEILKSVNNLVKSLDDKIKKECYYKGRLFYNRCFIYGDEINTL